MYNAVYIHIQPGWHICHIILEVLSTSYWAGQIGPVKTRPDCPIPNIVPLQCTSPSLTNGCMFLHVFACLQVFLAASPLYCWLKPFCLALLKLPHSKRRLASITHLFFFVFVFVCSYLLHFICSCVFGVTDPNPSVLQWWCFLHPGKDLGVLQTVTRRNCPLGKTTIRPMESRETLNK